MKSIFLAAFLALGFSGGALACSPPIKAVNGMTVDAHMRVKSGGSCSIVFRSSGPMDNVRIDQRPSHGVVDVGSIGRVRYRAKRGYIGSDVFIYTRYGRDDRNNPAHRSVRMHVTVTR